MYEIVSSVSAVIEARERRDRIGPEYTMTALGLQLWFMSDVIGDMHRPRGSSVGVVSVRVFMRTYGTFSRESLGRSNDSLLEP